jgi:hypothetical protein
MTAVLMGFSSGPHAVPKGSVSLHGDDTHHRFSTNLTP